jgi:hypothetical protein
LNISDTINFFTNNTGIINFGSSSSHTIYLGLVFIYSTLQVNIIKSSTFYGTSTVDTINLFITSVSEIYIGSSSSSSIFNGIVFIYNNLQCSNYYPINASDIISLFTNSTNQINIGSASSSSVFTGLVYIYNTLQATAIKSSNFASIILSDTISLFVNSTGIINFGSSSSRINIFSSTSIKDNLVISNNLAIGNQFNCKSMLCDNILSNTIQCSNLKVSQYIDTNYSSDQPIDKITIQGYIQIKNNGVIVFLPYYK